MPTLRAKHLLKKPLRYSDFDTSTSSKSKGVQFKLSAFENNVQNILRDKEFDKSFRDSRDVRSKMRTLRNYIDSLDWKRTVPEVQECLANHLDEDVDYIQKMWPQIADSIINSSDNFDKYW